MDQVSNSKILPLGPRKISQYIGKATQTKIKSRNLTRRNLPNLSNG